MSKAQLLESHPEQCSPSLSFQGPLLGFEVVSTDGIRGTYDLASRPCIHRRGLTIQFLMQGRQRTKVKVHPAWLELMALAPFTRRGRMPCSLCSCPFGGKPKTRSACKARGHVGLWDQGKLLDVLLWQHQGCEVRQGRTVGGPCCPPNIHPLGRTPEQKASITPARSPGMELQECGQLSQAFSWSGCSAVCCASVQSEEASSLRNWLGTPCFHKVHVNAQGLGKKILGVETFPVHAEIIIVTFALNVSSWGQGT